MARTTQKDTESIRRRLAQLPDDALVAIADIAAYMKVSVAAARNYKQLGLFVPEEWNPHELFKLGDVRQRVELFHQRRRAGSRVAKAIREVQDELG